MDEVAARKALIICVLVSAGNRGLYLQPSQAPQLQLGQHGAHMWGHRPVFLQWREIAGDRLLSTENSAGLRKGMRATAGSVSAALSQKTQEQLCQSPAK